MKAVAAVLLPLLALAVRALGAPPPEAPGPPFGDGRVQASFEERHGEPDLDQYTARLIRGERLTLQVRVPSGSDGRPAVALIGPDGVARDVAVTTRQGGRRVAVRGFEVDAAGVWTVRVADLARSGDAYTLRTRIRSPRRVRGARTEALGAGPPTEHAFHAVSGATIDLTLRAARKPEPVELVAILGPTGQAIGAAGAARREGRSVRLDAFPLEDGDGPYRLLVSTAVERAVYRVGWRVRPPARPRGRSSLGPEPSLAPVGEPLEGPGGSVSTLRGSGFGPQDTVRCWFGAEEATVLAVNGSGTEISVVVPAAAVTEPTSVLVVNPDGQFARRAAAFRRSEPRVLDVVALTPVVRQIEAGGSARFRLYLTDPAPPGGTGVALSVEGPIGTVPPLVTVPGGATLTTLDLTAAADPGQGRVLATLVRTVAAEVELLAAGTVPPPDPDPDPDPDPADVTLDLSGWQLQQEDSDRTFTFPVGTLVTAGGYVVLGRDVDRDAFGVFWGAQLGADVVYLDGAGFLPTINGQERYTLRDATGAVVDGPTVRMASDAGRVYQRVPGAFADEETSWVSGTSVFANANPGRGQARQDPPVGIYVSEFADAPGAGNFPHEFVELHFDGHPAEGQ